MSGSTEADSVDLRMDSGGPSGPTVAKRIDLPCMDVGFETPPAAVHVKPHRPDAVVPRWSLGVRTVAGKADAVAGWLTPWGPTKLRLDDGVAPTSLRAEFQELLGPWSLLEEVQVDHLVLIPEGTLSLVIEDGQEHVKRFLERLRESTNTNDLRVRDYLGNANLGDSGLTRRQEEVVSLAVALGYYDVPRKLNLRTIADRLGLSLGATSELIRRGESVIVAGYIDSLIGSFDDEADPKGPRPPGR